MLPPVRHHGREFFLFSPCRIVLPTGFFQSFEVTADTEKKFILAVDYIVIGFRGVGHDLRTVTVAEGGLLFEEKGIVPVRLGGNVDLGKLAVSDRNHVIKAQ